MHLLHHSKIIVPENRQRTEHDPDAHQELCTSITEHGLFSPLVLRDTDLDTGGTLVAGERRLRAIKDIYELGGTFRCNNIPIPEGFVPFLTLGELTPLQAMQAEYEENVRRLDLTWQDRAQAEASLLALTEKMTREPGITAAVAPLAKVAEASRGAATPSTIQAVTRSVTLANNLHRPEVASAKSAAEALKVLARIDQREQDAIKAAAMGKEFLGGKHRVLNTSALEFLSTCQTRFDVLLTDPPYGMGADEFGDSGGGAAGEHFYADDEATFRSVLDTLGLVSTVMKPDAHVYVFCDFDRFHQIKEVMRDAGWSVFRTPLIWVVPSKFRAPWPDYGPQRKYECILYAKRGDLKCTKLAGDVLTYPMDENLGHQAQKPVELFKDLLSRSVRPGMEVLDLFAGSGPILPAAHSLSAIATAVEIDPAAYALAAGRAEKLKEGK